MLKILFNLDLNVYIAINVRDNIINVLQFINDKAIMSHIHVGIGQKAIMKYLLKALWTQLNHKEARHYHSLGHIID